jgi:two-component system sensor histidine kinase CpxA
MHRLFWKFFLSFWGALVLFAAASIVAASHYLDQLREQENAVPPYEQLMRHVARAQAAADRDGMEGLKAWARQVDRREAVPILVLDAEGKDLLGKEVPARIRERFSRRAEVGSPPSEPSWARERRVVLADGSEYRLVRDYQAVTLTRILSRPRVVTVPLIVAGLASGLVCLLLARYLTAPIERLRRAAEGYAAGDLSQRVGLALGKRRDEIVDLALAFDHMAERLNVLMLSQKQLFRDISHELRSPLARLQAALGLARQRAGGVAQPELDRIERETERLNELIGQLLSLARLKSGALTPRMEPVDLVELLESVVADADLEARARSCEVRLEATVPALIQADAALLHSALENVVRNAIRYTAAGTAVRLSLQPDPAPWGGLLLQVRDQGPGVPEDMLPRLFEPFVRVGDARDRRSGGFGLGLAIAERAVRLHGGEISARNEPEGGLTVVIRLRANQQATSP